MPERSGKIFGWPALGTRDFAGLSRSVAISALNSTKIRALRKGNRRGRAPKKALSQGPVDVLSFGDGGRVHGGCGSFGYADVFFIAYF